MANSSSSGRKQGEKAQGREQVADNSHVTGNPYNVKVSFNDKLEDFDFYEMTGDLTNSLTDQLYRSYLPEVEEAYRSFCERGCNSDYKNDFMIGGMVDSIKKETDKLIVSSVSRAITDEVVKQLEEQYHPKKGSWEEWIDRAIKGVRWVFLPAFISVYIVAIALVFTLMTEALEMASESAKYGKKVWMYFFDGNIQTMDVRQQLNNVITSTLSILDLLLVGSLVVMVVVGGFENTIARVGVKHDVPSWFGKLDVGQLKIKVAASIVIISSIHLLMSFMRIDLEKPLQYSESIMWTAIVHAVFVFSALILAFMERVNDHRPIHKDK